MTCGRKPNQTTLGGKQQDKIFESLSSFFSLSQTLISSGSGSPGYILAVKIPLVMSMIFISTVILPLSSFCIILFCHIFSH